MAIEHRQEQGLHATATREDMRGVRRAAGRDEPSHVELASDPSTTGHIPSDLVVDHWTSDGESSSHRDALCSMTFG